MLLKLLRSAGVLGMALAVCLAAGPSGGQPPQEGKAAEGKGEFRLVPPLTLQEEGQVNSVAYSPDARLLASSSNRSTVRLWDARTGKLLWRHWFDNRNAPVFEVAFSPDGRTLACGVLYGTVRLLDVATGREVAVLRHAERYRVASVAFSPDGRWLVSGGDGLVVWDLRTRKRHLQLLDPGDQVNAVAFSPDGKAIASGSSDDPRREADWVVRVWDSDTGEEQGRFRDRRDGEILSLRFSPCGKVLACGSMNHEPEVQDQRELTRLREVATGRTIVKVDGPGWGVAFSPDGDLLLVSGGGRFECRLWEADTAKGVHTLVRRWNDVERVAFSPDGRAVALGTSDHRVLVQGLLPDLPGDGNTRLEADALGRLWADLGAEDPAKRYQAIWTLAAKPAEAVPLLTARLERPLVATDRKGGEDAVRVLELIDTPEARRLLQRLATEAGEGAVKQHAAAALHRLETRAQMKPLTITTAKPDEKEP